MPDYHTTVPPIARIDTAPEERSSFSNVYEFPATQWSIVARAAAKDTPEGAQALEALCARYWLPLYAFARRSGCSPEDAEDVTQDFIASVVRRNSLKTATPARGKLRTFLIAGIKNHIASHHRSETAATRRFDKIAHDISIDEAEKLLAEDSSAYSYQAESATEVFERRWAIALLDRVIQRLHEHYSRRGEEALFVLLRPFLSGVKRGGGDDGYVAVATQLGMSPNHVAVRVHRLKHHYREVLKEEIAATVEEHEVGSELQYLFSVFQR